MQKRLEWVKKKKKRNLSEDNWKSVKIIFLNNNYRFLFYF